MLKQVYYIPLFGLIAGCASTQLNYNTLDIASAVDDLVVQQVISNIVKIYRDQHSIPSQVAIITGNVTTSDSINPSINFPFTGNVTNAAGISGALSNASKTTLMNSGTASMGGNFSWNQSYTIQPLTDADTLRRLSLLYQYAAGHIGSEALLCRYPVPQQLAPSPGNSGQSSGGPASVSIVNNINIPDHNPPPPQPVRSPGDGASRPTGKTPDAAKAVGGKESPEKGGPKYVKTLANNNFCPFTDWPTDNGRSTWGYIEIPKPDPAFMTQPGCVVCDVGTFPKKEKLDPGYYVLGDRAAKPVPWSPNNSEHGLMLNSKLAPMKEFDGRKVELRYKPNEPIVDQVDWLKVVCGQDQLPETFEYVGQSGGCVVVVSGSDQGKAGYGGRERFANLVYSILDATLQANYNGKGSSLKGVTPTLNVGGR